METCDPLRSLPDEDSTPYGRRFGLRYLYRSLESGSGLHPADEVAQERWLIRKLDLAGERQNRKTGGGTNAELVKAIRIEAEYFASNRDAGCKTVIASRLNQSSMFWTVPGANAIMSHTSRPGRMSGRPSFSLVLRLGAYRLRLGLPGTRPTGRANMVPAHQHNRAPIRSLTFRAHLIFSSKESPLAPQ